MALVAYSIGVDLGQRQDHSAVAVVERLRTPPVFDPITWANRREESGDWVVRHLERIPLRASYTAVVARIVQLTCHPSLAGKCQLVVDATGVGMPVVDMLRDAHPQCPIVPVCITGGETPRVDGEVWRVPKMELMVCLQALFDSKCLRIAGRLPETAALVRELLDIRAWRTSAGHMKAAANGEGRHDDLAIAVALAVWAPRRPVIGHQPNRIL